MTDITVSAEILGRLESKLDAFAEQLDDDECNVLAGLLALGADQAAATVRPHTEPEVTGYERARLNLVGAFAPLSTEISSSKVQLHDFSFVKRYDKASPTLMNK